MGGTYHQPDNLEAALQCRAKGAPIVAAGCTDLFPATERKQLTGDILDLSQVEEMKGLTLSKSGLRIGAMSTWADVAKSDLPPACRALQQAARQVGALQIQNRATVAGNLCNASPAADGVPPLLALDASVILASATGERSLPLSQFVKGPRQTALRRDELLSAVHIPAKSLLGASIFQKLGARSYLVISIVMTAVRLELEKGVVRSAAFSVGACGPVATRLPELEAGLVGRPLDPELIKLADIAPSLSPIDDVRGDASFRAEAVVEMLRRSVVTLGDAR